MKNGKNNIAINLKSNHSIDRRYNNKPVAGQMAVLMPGDGSDMVENRDILLTTTQGELNRISELHPSYDPLQYVILFPTGDFGYHPNINYRVTSSKKISCREYYAYKIMVREHDDSLQKSRRLFCQYVVDMYAKQESFRLTLDSFKSKRT